MKPTSIPRVSLTKSFFTRFSSVIHPPLPLTPIESRKFLSLIKDSFRTQLSATTPAIAPTEQHFSKIVSAAQSGIPVTDELSKEERIKRFLEDPLGVFTEQALLGSATPDLAAVCLMKHAKLQQGKPANGAREVRDEESAAGVVLGELRKAGFGAPAVVLRNEDLLRAVTYSLIGEGRIDVLVRWARVTKEESLLPLRRSIVKQTVYYIMHERGWMFAAEFFRQVVQGSRENQSRFSLREHCSTGLKLCEAGLKEGLGKTPEFARLVRSSVHWAINWQQQAAVNLAYGKMTGVGLKYFYSLAENGDSFWEHQKSPWYHQNSRLAMGLVLECLEQKQVKEAEMINELVKKRFAEKVGLGPEDVGAKMDEDKARTEMITENLEDGEHSSDLQGVLNSLG